MYPDDPRQNPMNDPKHRPSQILLVLMAVGIATVVTLFGMAILYLAEIWNARPLGL